MYNHNLISFGREYNNYIMNYFFIYVMFRSGHSLKLFQDKYCQTFIWECLLNIKILHFYEDEHSASIKKT